MIVGTGIGAAIVSAAPDWGQIRALAARSFPTCRQSWSQSGHCHLDAECFPTVAEPIHRREGTVELARGNAQTDEARILSEIGCSCSYVLPRACAASEAGTREGGMQIAIELLVAESEPHILAVLVESD